MLNPLANALIFIPDISGFSHFVKDTDVEHSQHIIKELLEEIIDANSVDLKISEVEGDAILFYKDLTEDTGIIDLTRQVREMYYRFHTHLKMYEHQRICQCGACSTASSLKLKFVIHNGPVSFNSVGGHEKLFGEHIIQAHRLLKNEIASKEYALFSNSILNYYKLLGQQLDESLSKPQSGSEVYDIGEISYQYCDLRSLSNNVPAPQFEKYGLNGRSTIIDKTEHIVDAPIRLVFNVLTDYTIRHNWSNDVNDSADINSFIARNGSSHRCVIKNNSSDPFFNAHDFEINSDRVVFQETDQKLGVSNIYELERSGSGNQTKITMTNSIRGGRLKGLIFKLLIIKKIRNSKEETFGKIEAFCHDLIKTNKKPQQQIELAASFSTN